MRLLLLFWYVIVAVCLYYFLSSLASRWPFLILTIHTDTLYTCIASHTCSSEVRDETIIKKLQFDKYNHNNNNNFSICIRIVICLFRFFSLFNRLEASHGIEDSCDLTIIISYDHNNNGNDGIALIDAVIIDRGSWFLSDGASCLRTWTFPMVQYHNNSNDDDDNWNEEKVLISDVNSSIYRIFDKWLWNMQPSNVD